MTHTDCSDFSSLTSRHHGIMTSLLVFNKMKIRTRVEEDVGAANGSKSRALHALPCVELSVTESWCRCYGAEVSQTPGMRRSGRHRVAPLKFWKGDNIQYGLDEKGLPVAEGIVKGPAGPAPAPSRSAVCVCM